MTMGKTSRLVIAALTACVLPIAASAQGKSGAAARITTGTVERADRTRLDSNAAPGVLVGGTLGLLSASGKSDGRKARNAIIGAGAGAMIANAAQGSREGMVYTVRTGPSSSIRIVSDQVGIMVGDCVAVEESGQTNNIRRVSMEVCDKGSQKVVTQLKTEFESEASECALAKDQLVAATSAEAIDLAIRKVKILCNN
jgi:hypothetical protein